MIERDPQFDGPFEEAAQPFELHETLQHWTQPAQEEELSEEEQLANFLEALGKSDQHVHEASTGDATNPVGRRAAPRLRLSLPARFVAVEEVHKAILLNISRTGAMIAILSCVREGEGGFLECGKKLKQFAIITRSEFSINAMQFEEPLSEEAVLDIRRYYENFEERERRQLIETARNWVNGATKDERIV